MVEQQEEEEQRWAAAVGVFSGATPGRNGRKLDCQPDITFILNYFFHYYEIDLCYSSIIIHPVAPVVSDRVL
jgi:hypothetical protein